MVGYQRDTNGRKWTNKQAIAAHAVALMMRPNNTFYNAVIAKCGKLDTNL
jgi:hypothetical protein